MTSEHFKMLLNLRNDESESIASSNPLNVLSTEEKDEKNKKITNIKKNQLQGTLKNMLFTLGYCLLCSVCYCHLTEPGKKVHVKTKKKTLFSNGRWRESGTNRHKIK